MYSPIVSVSAASIGLAGRRRPPTLSASRQRLLLRRLRWYGGNEYKFDTTGSVRTRISYALLYGAAGWTGARGRVNTPVGDDGATFLGWTVGADLDYAFTNNTFGRVECRYNDYGSKDLLGVDIEFNQNVVTVGVGFKF